MTPYFITGIGTDIGKTIVSAVLTEKLRADYWKPIQSGDLENSDSIKVGRLVSNSLTKIHPEGYRLSQPFSPHKSAHLDGLKLDIDSLKLPITNNRLIIEGAGGLMVPINEKHYIVDLISHFKAEVILISKNYLGSINHTLLSIELLKNRKIPIKGIVINGESDPYSEEAIFLHSDLKLIGRIPFAKGLNPDIIRAYGSLLDI